jgi:hypothetical protein
VFRSLLSKDKKICNFGINISKDEDCVILANGHSLVYSLQGGGGALEFIKKNKKFCVNDSILSLKFWDLRPEYYVFMDPLYWARDVSEPYLSRHKQIAELLDKVNWPLRIFMPKDASDWNFFIELPVRNKNIEIIYINIQPTKLSMDDKLRFVEYKYNYATPYVQNVLAAVLYIAINIGFRNIYIFGADHDWTKYMDVSKDNILYVDNKHYFAEEKTYTPVLKDATCTQYFTCADYYKAMYLTFAAYYDIEEYSQYINSKVYNASKISFIDAFERIKI